MDKNPKTIRTVVNKIGQIETEFRTFPMEVRISIKLYAEVKHIYLYVGD